jgi:hypothetical protein
MSLGVKSMVLIDIHADEAKSKPACSLILPVA